MMCLDLPFIRQIKGTKPFSTSALCMSIETPRKLVDRWPWIVLHTRIHRLIESAELSDALGFVEHRAAEIQWRTQAFIDKHESRFTKKILTTRLFLFEDRCCSVLLLSFQG